jgi:hypothetical protein
VPENFSLAKVAIRAVKPSSSKDNPSQEDQIPPEGMLASPGGGNPTALAQLNSGDVVFDLGSGGGIDVLLSAKGWLRHIAREIISRGVFTLCAYSLSKFLVSGLPKPFLAKVLKPGREARRISRKRKMKLRNEPNYLT